MRRRSKVLVFGVLLLGAGALIAPNFFHPRKGGNESAAIGALKAICNAQVLFREGDKDRDGTLQYAASLQQLVNTASGEDLIDEVLAGGTKQGYRFSMGRPDPQQYWVKAEPVPGSGHERYFYVDQSHTLCFSREDFIAPIVSGQLPVLNY